MSTRCQLGLVCPGERTAGSNTTGMVILGRPIQKHQIWMANFDLGPMNRGCRSPAAFRTEGFSRRILPEYFLRVLEKKRIRISGTSDSD